MRMSSRQPRRSHPAEAPMPRSHLHRGFALIELVGQPFQADAAGGANKSQAGKPDLRCAFTLIELLVIEDEREGPRDKPGASAWMPPPCGVVFHARVLEEREAP